MALRWSRLRRIWPVLTILLLWFGHPTSARAVSCSATVTNVDFGFSNLLSTAPTDTLATVNITCTALGALDVVKLCPSIDDGTGGANGQVRFMRGTTSNAALSYGLYQDANRSVPWGAISNPELGTVPAIILSSVTGTATAVRTLYARQFGGQTAAPPDTYRSVFEGAEVAFSWSQFLLTATNTCTGFMGTHVIRPAFTVLSAPLANCNLTTTNLTFPNSGTLTSGVSGTAGLGVTCTNASPYSVSIDNGQNGTSPTARKMSSPASATVTYGLFRDAAHTLPWGAAAAAQAATGNGTGSVQNYTVYGYVPPQTTPAPGTYSDRVVVTVTY